MPDLGFWNGAKADPSKLALVTPDEVEVTRGELLAEANRLTHGLRALGLERGDAIAVVVPNGQPMVELYLAAFQSGWYLTPINNHLAGPEIAYIVNDSEAKVFVVGERFAETCQAAAKEIQVPDGARFCVGSVPSFKPYATLTEGQPDTLPDDRSAGAVMNTLNPRPGTSIAIFGCGSVGLAAVLGANVTGCAVIIAVDPNPSRLELAHELGATHAIDPTQGDPVEAIQQIRESGVHFSLECAGKPEVLRQAVDSLTLTGVAQATADRVLHRADVRFRPTGTAIDPIHDVTVGAGVIP